MDGPVLPRASHSGYANEATEDERLIAQTDEEHERAMLEDFRSSSTMIEIPKLSALRSSELLVPHVSLFTSPKR
jgi:hypothetical protein